MQNLEKIIRKGLKKRLSDFKRTDVCPSELELGRYLEGNLALSQREKIERHLADCPYCLDVLIVAKDILRASVKKEGFLQRLAKQKWLILTGLSFLLSFFIKRYFLQFLFLSLILGIKWALSAEGSRNLVMIFRSLSHKEGESQKPEEKIFARK